MVVRPFLVWLGARSLTELLVMAGLVVLVGLLCHRNGRRLILATLAPILDNDNGAVSLGRLSLAAIVAALVTFIVRNPKEFSTLGAWAAFLVSLVFLALVAYVYGNKPWMSGYLTAIIGRLPGGNQLLQHVTTRETTATTVVVPTEEEAAPLPEEDLPEPEGPTPLKDPRNG